MEAGRDYQMIQTGGALEVLAALLSGAIDADTMSSPWYARKKNSSLKICTSGATSFFEKLWGRR